MEFIGTIWKSAPYQCGDRVDHHPEFVSGRFHFELFLSPGTASRTPSIFGMGRELRVVMDRRAPMVLQSQLEIRLASMLFSTSLTSRQTQPA
jgi:hypothetical protein